MEDSDLQSKAKERWTSKIPSILEQAKLEDTLADFLHFLSKMLMVSIK